MQKKNNLTLKPENYTIQSFRSNIKTSKSHKGHDISSGYTVCSTKASQKKIIIFEKQKQYKQKLCSIYSNLDQNACTADKRILQSRQNSASKNKLPKVIQEESEQIAKPLFNFVSPLNMENKVKFVPPLYRNKVDILREEVNKSVEKNQKELNEINNQKRILKQIEKNLTFDELFVQEMKNEFDSINQAKKAMRERLDKMAQQQKERKQLGLEKERKQQQKQKFLQFGKKSALTQSKAELLEQLAQKKIRTINQNTIYSNQISEFLFENEYCSQFILKQKLQESRTTRTKSNLFQHLIIKQNKIIQQCFS
eukprot:TRINITY_DN3951_c0_g1_i2.p1 TRINITY_DN3951_c0_g1~~TRINITY_DN3951_c0_g1_i2.p1  ORF type:complete len:310 (+),score=67.37 TRINITY_DN3951_c0_g1_i2:287-1216(+)